MTNLKNADYKKIEFDVDPSDKMFTYYYPDLSDFGINNEEKTFLVSNKKRHLHINIAPELQRKGLSSLLIKAFIYWEGYRIIPKARITNPNVIKVLNKINEDPKFIVTDEDNHFLIDEALPSTPVDREIFTVNHL